MQNSNGSKPSLHFSRSSDFSSLASYLIPTVQFSKDSIFLHFFSFYLLQANEETGNRRPVMISLTETPKPVLDTKESKSDDKSSDEEMKDITDQVQKTTNTENSDQAEQTKTNQLLPKLKKLSDVECSTLLHACVSLMGLSVDADALNAILRLLLRLTQDFEQAVVFAQLGGVKMLLVSFQTFMIKILYLVYSLISMRQLHIFFN